MKKRVILLISILILLVLTSFTTLAHEESATFSEKNGIDWTNPSPYIILSGIWLILFTFIIILGKNYIDKVKKPLFVLMIVPIILSSFYLSGYTIYENIISETGGPVHWHADYQVWICGNKVDLINPMGIKNKIGTSTFHEHNDNRIHFEGTPKKIEDISVGNFFKSIEGELESSPGHLIFPTNDKTYNYKDGDLCPDSTSGILKVYVNGKRISKFEDYIIYPNPNVPPGDCIIILFDETEKEMTDILCESWEVQGWNYDNFQREKIKIGENTWQ